MALTILLISSFVAVNILSLANGVPVNAEYELFWKLTTPEDHLPSLRPVLNFNDNVTVSLGIAVYQLLEVNERRQTVTLDVWFTKAWKDVTLKWSLADYPGMTHMWLPYDKLWIPDITLFTNGVHESPGEPLNKLCLVSPDGSVLWLTQEKIVVACAMDVRRFPYDDHLCNLELGSWMYSVDLVDVNFYAGVKEINLQNFIGHDEWHLTSEVSARHVTEYDCCTDKYSDITFEFRIKRLSGYYDCVFIAPAIFLAMLIPLIFVLDGQRKFTMGIGIIISLTVFIKVMTIIIPVAHGGVPVLAQYYVGLFSLTCLALILASITEYVGSRGKVYPPPRAAVRNFTAKLLLSVRILYLSPEGLESQHTNGTPMNQENDIPMGDEPASIQRQCPPASVDSVKEWNLVRILLDRIFFIIFLNAIIIFSLVVICY